MATKLKVTPAAQGKKHRVHLWIDTQTLGARYGVQANIQRGVWAHVHDGKQVVLFNTIEEAQAQAKAWSA